MNIVNPLNYKPGVVGRETNELPSETIPGETRTIKEILDMYQEHRQFPEGDENLRYFDVEDVGEINKYFNPGALDLTDLQQLQEKNNRMNQIIKKAQEKKAKEEAEKAEQEKIEAKAQELLNSQENPEE